MDFKNASQYADVRVNTTELSMIITALETIDSVDYAHLHREMEDLYKTMTGKNYGER